MKPASLATLLLLLTTPILAQEIPAAEYTARRERVARSIGANAMLVLTSPEPAQRNGDVSYPFRQDDHLLYLTGITQPNTSLVLIPSEGQYREILFVDEADPAREVWTGRLMTVEEARARSGVAEVSGSATFRPFLDAALSGSPFGTSDVYRYFRGASMPAFRELVRGGRAVVWVPLRRRGSSESDAPRELRLVTDLHRRSVFDTITTATLKSSRVPLPDRADRIRFHEVAEALFMRILANQRESQTLAQLRDTLLPKLLSGEIRVGAAEREVAEVV